MNSQNLNVKDNLDFQSQIVESSSRVFSDNEANKEVSEKSQNTERSGSNSLYVTTLNECTADNRNQKQNINNVEIQKQRKKSSPNTLNSMSHCSIKMTKRQRKNLEMYCVQYKQWKTDQTCKMIELKESRPGHAQFSTRILKPNDYLFFSVFTTIFCCFPLGKL